MGSGFIIGGIWGLLVSAGALAVASLIGDPPAREIARPFGEAADESEAETTDEAARAAAEGPGGQPDDTIIVSGEVEVVPVTPAQDEAEDAPAAELAEGPPPPVSAEAPEAPVGGEVLAEAPDAPALAPRREALPLTPRADVPAGRGAVPEAETEAEDRPGAVADAGSAPQPAPDTAAAPGPAPEVDQPVLPGPPSRVIEVPAEEADITVVTDPPPPPSEAPREVVDARPEPSTDEAQEVEASEDSEAPEIAALAEPPASPPLAMPAPPERPEALPDMSGTITVLPAPGEAGEDAARPLPGRAAGLSGGDAVPVRRPGLDDEEAPVEAAPLPDDAPALMRFAAPDLADAGEPRMSIVLLDTGALDNAVAAASTIPFPVTIGIDAEAPDAAARAARWRDAGYEIAAIARLPQGAAPSDVEVTFESAFNTLPEAVALLDLGDAGLLSDADVTAQALDRLARDGRGLVALPRGLATPMRQAEARGVPALEVYRDLGEVGQDDRVIRRFLDQAAFRARQQGAVTLLAPLNPESITALTLWGNRVDREGVAPSPVSALLQLQLAGPVK